MTPPVVAVDHFAGTGWGVACHWLGIREYGVEKMPEAIRTRGKVGFRTIYRDVWSGLVHPWLVPFHRLYIASPPCQTFSVAGRGEGRNALDQVLALIDSGAWKDPARLLAAACDLGDERTALVLTPLAHIWAHRPELIALEQVPTVLPVWEAIGHVLRGFGYSVWTGNMQAEMYGVPQTRKRAILIARADGIPARPPVPTHSRYYSRNPEKLDPGVQKWVSMAEALGWGMTARPYPTIATGTENGGTDPAALGGSGARRGVYAEREAGRWSPSGDADNDGGILRLQAAEAAAIQTYPGGWVYRNGNQANSARRPLDAPAPTIHFGQRSNKVEWIPAGLADDPSASGVRVSPDEAAILQSYPVGLRDEVAAWRWVDAPATTIAGDPRITAREHHFHGEQAKTSLKLTVDEAITLQSYPDWVFERPAPTVVGTRRSQNGMLIGRQLDDGSRRDVGGHQTDVGLRRGMLPGVRVSGEQGAVLQSYPVPFPFQGARGKQFLQIGNAVPPLLAEAILRELVEPRVTMPLSDADSSRWEDVFAEVAA